MYRLNNITQNILLISSAALLVGCGGGSGDLQIQEDTEASLTFKATQQGKISDSDGISLSNVDVSIGSHTTTTDADGFYTLQNIPVSEEAVVTFEKEGYLLGSTKIQIKELSGDNTTSLNYLEYNMYTHDHQWDYNSTGEILSPRIAIDASVTYTDTEGKPYSGTISADLTVLDPEEEALLPAFPGVFKGINRNGAMVQFESYGLFSISLKDSNNNTLSLANGEIATLTFKAISSTEDQTTIPLWYYNYDQGTWIEEGYAELQGDGTYKGEVSHLGTWSLNRPIENDPGIYRGRILYEDGTPASDVRVNAIGDNWISTDLTTDKDGAFEIEVIPSKNFKISAYNYKDKYKASYNSRIPAVVSGDIVGN